MMTGKANFCQTYGKGQAGSSCQNCRMLWQTRSEYSIGNSEGQGKGRRSFDICNPFGQGAFNEKAISDIAEVEDVLMVENIIPVER